MVELAERRVARPLGERAQLQGSPLPQATRAGHSVWADAGSKLAQGDGEGEGELEGAEGRVSEEQPERSRSCDCSATPRRCDRVVEEETTRGFA